MNRISKIYIIGYLVSTVLGYDFLSKIINGDKFEIINLNKNSCSFICRRPIKLSLVALLLSSNFFNNPTYSNYISMSLIQCVILSCYLIKWRLKDKIDYLTHVAWAVPVLFYPYFNQLKMEKLNSKTMVYTMSLLFFYYYFQDYIYINNLKKLE